MLEDTFLASIALLRTRRYGTFWFASLLSSIGTWAQLVAQPWVLLSLGASSQLLGLDAFAMSAPAWLLTPAGGVLADRADRRRVIAAFQSIQMLCPLSVVILLWTGGLTAWVIVCLSLVIGLTDALSMPSFASIVPSIVEEQQIGAGLALNSAQFNISRISGPALAGVLMSTVGAAGCFVTSALSYVPFIAVALWILPRGPAAAATRSGFVWRDVLAEWRGILQLPDLRGALQTTFCSGLLCGPLITFCPLLVRDVFHGGAALFSVSVSAFGVGGVAGAISLLAVDSRKDRRRLSSWAAGFLGLSVVLSACLPWYPAAVAALLCAGGTMSVANTAANTVVQSAAASELRGQAVSSYMLALRGGTALGALLTGVSVTTLGVRNALLLNGVLAMLLQVRIGRRWLSRSVAIVPDAV